jgi:hypothetical protein
MNVRRARDPVRVARAIEFRFNVGPVEAVAVHGDRLRVTGPLDERRFGVRAVEAGTTDRAGTGVICPEHPAVRDRDTGGTGDTVEYNPRRARATERCAEDRTPSIVSPVQPTGRDARRRLRRAGRTVTVAHPEGHHRGNRPRTCDHQHESRARSHNTRSPSHQTGHTAVTTTAARQRRLRPCPTPRPNTALMS